MAWTTLNYNVILGYFLQLIIMYCPINVYLQSGVYLKGLHIGRYKTNNAYLFNQNPTVETIVSNLFQLGWQMGSSAISSLALLEDRDRFATSDA